MNTHLDENFRGKRVLITGGLGFIGSNLARRLVGMSAQLCLLDALAPKYGGNPFNIADIREQVQVITADVRETEQLKLLIPGQHYLFNLAAQVSHVGSIQNPLHDLEVNAVSQLSILEICRQANPGIHIVYAGTRQIYGHAQYLPVDEKHPVEPADYNGVSKLAAEQYHMVAHRIYGLWTTSLRLTNSYGPRMRVRDAYKTFLGDWFRRVIRGEKIHIYGNGRQIRDFNFVDDVVEALLLCAVNPAAAGQTFNLGGGEPVSLLALAKLLIEVNGSGAYRLTSFPADRERIDIGDYYGDYTKIRTQLGWQPKVNLREGLTRTLEYYRQNGEHYW